MLSDNAAGRGKTQVPTHLGERRVPSRVLDLEVLRVLPRHGKVSEGVLAHHRLTPVVREGKAHTRKTPV